MKTSTAWMVLVGLVVLVLGAGYLANADTTSFQSPTDVDFVANDWTNPNYAFTSNNWYTNANNNGYAQAYDEFGGFSLPASSTVTGIEAEVDAKQEGTSCQLQVRLSGNNGSSFTSYKTMVPAGSETTLIYGGDSDMWGTTWDDTKLSNANFVLEMKYNDPDSNCDTSGSSRDDIYVDHIRVKVHYTLPVPPAPTPTPTPSHSGSTLKGGGGMCSPATGLPECQGAANFAYHANLGTMLENQQLLSLYQQLIDVLKKMIPLL